MVVRNLYKLRYYPIQAEILGTDIKNVSAQRMSGFACVVRRVKLRCFMEC